MNTRTHDYATPTPARVRGWRRGWRALHGRPVSFLTAVPDPDAEIEGLVAAVPDGDWRALDEREAFYLRKDATTAITPLAAPGARVAIYEVPGEQTVAPTRDAPILLSYLDVVLQGYLDVFGEPGAERFFDTTVGWDAPILNDRDAPRYPRAQTLAPQERGYVDAALEARGIVPFTA